jgi:hypothetical protein
VSEGKGGVRLTDEQRLDWLRLIRSQNIGPRGISQQTHLSLGVVGERFSANPIERAAKTAPGCRAGWWVFYNSFP